jgi:hypothetical protein
MHPDPHIIDDLVRLMLCLGVWTKHSRCLSGC